MTELSQHPLNKKFDLDGAINAIWLFYKKWFAQLFVISFVFSLITSIITSRIDLSSIYQTMDPEEMLMIFRSMIGPYFLILLFSFLFSIILQYYIIRKPVEPESNFIGIASTSVYKYFLPMIVLSVIIGVFAMIAITLGIFILLIGAIFAFIYVAMISTFIAPVLMIENKNIGDTLSRTIQLSHKTFWPNIGWVCVVGILLLVVSGILGAVIMIPFGGSFLKVITNPENAGEIMNFASKPSFIILSSLTNAITMPLYPIFALVLYFSRTNSESGVIEIDDHDSSGRKVSVDDLTP